MSEQHLTRHFQYVMGSGEYLGCIQDKTRAKKKKKNGMGIMQFEAANF